MKRFILFNYYYTTRHCESKCNQVSRRWMRCKEGGESKEFTARGKSGLPQRERKSHGKRQIPPGVSLKKAEFYPRKALAGVSLAF
jgi:hypothetical protein